MKISKGIIAGLGVASLLVALPAAAQSSGSGSSGSSGDLRVLGVLRVVIVRPVVEVG